MGESRGRESTLEVTMVLQLEIVKVGNKVLELGMERNGSVWGLFREQSHKRTVGLIGCGEMKG